MNTKFTATSILALSRRYQNLLASQKFVDCSFNVEQTIIKGHKLILSAASPVFEAMFYGPMSEQNNIEILDISAEAFQLMIEYIYTSEIDFEKISLENAIELYYSAEKYLLTDLVRLCLGAIPSKFRFQNILPTMDLSVYMDLQPLLQICMNFFEKCCIQGHEYKNFIKTNYYHVTRECLKLIVKLNFDSKYLCWFIREWCQNECKSLDLNENEYNLVLNDLELPALLNQLDCPTINDSNISSKSYYIACNYIERIYYKARKPFIITDECNEFNVILKTDRFISLLGVVINSRLMPRINVDTSYDQDYNESLNVEIQSNHQVIHKQKVIEKTSYNCDLNILMKQNVILSPAVEYCIKLIWDRNAFGGEYPCSLYSNEAGGITFTDQFSHLNDNGSIFKGIKYLNLV